MKLKIEDIKDLMQQKNIFLHPIAALFQSKKISNNKEFSAQYIRNESAKVVQQTLYEYVRNRNGNTLCEDA